MDRISLETETRLAENIARFYGDPLGFVMFVFPWGKPGTSLAEKKGPEPWQRELLVRLGEHIRENQIRRDIGLDMDGWWSAVASGHGVGKSAIVAWLIYFLMSTRPNTRGVVTANTGNQLETKTWPELAKWHALAINKHWFQWTAKSFYFAKYPEDLQKTYMVNAITVSEENTEAFAGLHNEGRTVFLIKDEASGIAEKIYEVAEGAMTDGETFSFDFGNPTRPQGPFFDEFTKNRHHMSFLKNVDSREVSHTNKLALQKLIDKYGPDSDVVKYRVYGQFPEKAYDGFISPTMVETAIRRETWGDTGAALIMAVDVARYGDDETVIGFRQGRDARSIPWRYFHGLSTTRVTEQAKIAALKYKPEAIVIEAVGPGIGVIDQLKDAGFRVVEAYPGAQLKADSPFFNQRAEWWFKGNEWLQNQGCIHDDKDLYSQLTEILYQIREKGKLIMESKEDMKSRGLPSPDRADTLMLTFAATVQRRDARAGGQGRPRQAIVEYDPLSV